MQLIYNRQTAQSRHKQTECWVDVVESMRARSIVVAAVLYDEDKARDILNLFTLLYIVAFSYIMRLYG